MKNLVIKIVDEGNFLEGEFKRWEDSERKTNKLLGRKIGKRYEERLKRFEGNFLEMGKYLIPFFKIPFLENAKAELDVSENVGSSQKGKIRIDYISGNYSGRREITSKGLFLKMDKEEFYKSKRKVEMLSGVKENLENYISR